MYLFVRFFTRCFVDPLLLLFSHLSFYAGLWGFFGNPFFLFEKIILYS